VAWVERGDGVRLYWEERGAGPGLLLTQSYIQHPDVMTPLADQLAQDHRLVRYDARGSGESTPSGPYDMDTDVADMLAVAEAAGPLAATLANGDAANRAVHAAAERPDLIPIVVSLETLPLVSVDAGDTDALVGSGGVLTALIGLMRNDYRAGMRAAIERGNPDMTDDELHERIDRTVAYIPHEAGLGRLEAWVRDEPGDDALALRDRLVLAYEGAGAWFTAELHERARAFIPDARFERLAGGAISRPELTAAVVRDLTGAARA
jgi:pimeloyl-ACP methyl ester carboxylesterase